MNNTFVDLLTYNEGINIALPNLITYRIRDFSFLHNVRPGFSYKKLVCDFLFFYKALLLVNRNHYDLIHAGEEASFIAMFLKLIYKIPYVYDLDSSIAQQLVEKNPILLRFSPFFEWIEGKAIKNSVDNFDNMLPGRQYSERDRSRSFAI